MSDSEESGVTYTDISNPFEELSDIGSPRADDHEYLMLPEMLEDPYIEVALQAPPSPDYIPGPEEPEQAPPSPYYIPGPGTLTTRSLLRTNHMLRMLHLLPKIVRLLAISSLPASPLSPWSSPPPQIPFPPLPPILSPPSPILSPAPPPSPIRRIDQRLPYHLGRGESSSAAAARPVGGFRADYGFVATVDREIMRDPEREVRYGITDPWDEIVEALTMSDSDESGVTYTDISSPFEELSDIGSPRADDHEHLMLPEMLEDPYVEVALQTPPLPDYVPGPEHADDEIVAEDQPYAEDASPIAQSPEYVPESDFEAHPEDDDDEDPEEDPVDYPADEGDDGDDEEESSEDDEEDEDDDMDVEADEEEEHPAPADSVVVAPTAADQAPSVEETEPFETDEEDRPEVTLPPRKRLDIALGPRYEVGESSSATAARPAGGFRADYSFVATVDKEIMRDPEREIGYGITDSWDEIVETLQGAPVSTDTELGGYVREFETRVRQDTYEIYMRDK
nr:hypothetical protein [Tanacetum cinerariifolium]